MILWYFRGWEQHGRSKLLGFVPLKVLASSCLSLWFLATTSGVALQPSSVIYSLAIESADGRWRPLTP